MHQDKNISRLNGKRRKRVMRSRSIHDNDLWFRG